MTAPPPKVDLVARCEEVRRKATDQLARWRSEGRCEGCGSPDGTLGVTNPDANEPRYAYTCAPCRDKAG